MGTLTKKIITEITFRDSLSEPSDVRYLKLEYDSEGAGRGFMLTDGSKGCAIFLNTADDFRQIYEAAKELEEQGTIYCESEDW